MEVYFPEVFKGQSIGFNSARIDNLKARIQAIITKQSNEVQKTIDELLRLTKPKFWNPTIEGNMEVATEREYENLMITLGKHAKIDKNKITIFELYSLRQNIIETNKQAENKK